MKSTLTSLFARAFAVLLISQIFPQMFAQSPEPETANPRMSLWAGQAPVAEGQTAEEDAFITCYKPENPNGAAVIVCPGGAYGFLCIEPEGHNIARWLVKSGITAFVLEYRLPQGRPMVPLWDAQQAIRTVRSKAKEFGIDPQRVGIMGFSAGGHLASSTATHFEEGKADDENLLSRLSSRPDFAVLVYPVITMGPGGHDVSHNLLVGGRPDSKEMEEFFSNQNHVTSRTPPCFLTHAVDDGMVPVTNSRDFYAALKARGVPCEYLELPDGNHGLNGYQGKSWDAWQSRSLEWMKEQGFLDARK